MSEARPYVPVSLTIPEQKKAKKAKDKAESIDIAKREYATEAISKGSQSETYSRVAVCDQAYKRLARLIGAAAAKAFAKTEANR